MKTWIVLAFCIAGAYTAPSSSYNDDYSEQEVKESSYSAPAPVMRTVVRISPKKEAPIQNSYVAPSYAVNTPAQGYAQNKKVKQINPITNFELDNDHYGSYSLKSLAGDGSGIQQQATVKDLKDEEGKVSEVLVMSGSYSYIGDDNVKYTVDWVADENGFRAAGAHLPTSVPAQI